MLDGRKLSDGLAAVLPVIGLVLQRWADLAHGRDPGASNPERPGADQFEWPSEPPGAEDRYSEMPLIEGPARRNRRRKRPTRLGSDGHDPRIRADYEKRQRRLARLHQLRGLGDAKVLKSLGHSPKGRHYRG
jgi:hypothetical protein